MLALDWESMERERFMGFSWMSEWRLRLSVWSYDLFVKTCWGLTCFYPRKLHPSQCPSHGTSQPCPLCCLEDLKIRHAALSHGHPGHWCCHLGATMTWPLCTNCNCESRECKGLLLCQPHRFAVLRVNYSPSNTHKQTPWNKQRNFSTTILLNQSIDHLPTLIFNPGSKKKVTFLCVRSTNLHQTQLRSVHTGIWSPYSPHFCWDSVRKFLADFFAWKNGHRENVTKPHGKKTPQLLQIHQGKNGPCQFSSSGSV